MEKVLPVREPANRHDVGELVKSRPRFALRTLGSLTLVGPDGREVATLATRRRKLVVLAWLAMRRTPATRDQVIGMFWGGRNEARARNSLADALSHIRRVLGPRAVPSFSERVALADDVPLGVDAIALASTASAGDHARVVELYAGDFLDGVHVDDSIEFERWRDGERSRLAALFARSAAARSTELARARQWDSCALLARRWLDAEPASADAALRLLDALAAPDTHAARVAALVAFEDLRERLRCDLGVAPAPAVVERARALAAIVAPTSSATLPSVAQRAPAIQASSRIVGRTHEQHALSDALARAANGQGNVVCISGEPGIGKTTLVEAWLAERAGTGVSMWVARGRCSERMAGVEAYLPVLDALDELISARDGPAAAAVVRRVAPLWYSQLAPGARLADGGTTQAPPPTQERLKREIVALVQELGNTRPVVLFVDDVHWSDSSTVDLVTYLSTRIRALRLLVVVTYREEDLRAARHPFLRVALDLESRGIAREYALPFFSVDEVARYVDRELAHAVSSPSLAALLHARTEGSPLFVAELLRELRQRAGDGPPSPQELERAASVVADEMPRSVRAMVRRKIVRLRDDDRRLLTAASMHGVEFDAAIVAAATGLEPASVEERLDAMADEDSLIRRAGENAYPDGSAAARYRFVHALYHEALYTTLGPARRRKISAAVADAIVQKSGACTSGMDSQLGYLYQTAGDAARAVHHYVRAADDSGRLFAHREVILLCRRALGLITSLPDTPERTITAMRLHFSIGFSTMIVDGYGAPEARDAFTNAEALAVRLGDPPAVFPMIAGMFSCYVIAGDAAQIARLAGRMGEIAEGDAASPLAVMSHLAAGLVLHSAGDQAGAQARFERALACYDPTHHAMHLALYRLDAGIFSLAQSSRTLWLTGYADRALARAEEAAAMARGFGHPGSVAFAMTFVAIVRQFRREPEQALARADETISFCDAHDIAQERAWALPVRAWALSMLGKSDEGIPLMREAIAGYAATGAQHTLPYYYSLLADALLAVDSPCDAVAACDEGLRISERIGERAYDAELHRLRAECLLRTGGASAGHAEPELREALSIADAQQSRAYALRAATSLASAWRNAGRLAEASALLGPSVEWFTEGLETPDLLAARRLFRDASRIRPSPPHRPAAMPPA
jgi:DNA-binding SARP family transcriptional activator/predicted ATPase